MPRLKTPSIRITAVVERAFQALLIFVLAGVIYRYCWNDVTDPFKCGALLTKGEWLDPGSRYDTPRPFQNWQPPGCMMRKYQKKDIENCFHERRIVFIGDSTTRQIYWAVAKKMGQQQAEKEMTDLLETEEKHKDLEFRSAKVTVQFTWDPWLNSTTLERELKNFKPDPADGPEAHDSAGVILLGAPGLWYARHGEENFFRHFRDTIDNIIPYMDHEPEDKIMTPFAKPFSARKQSPNFLLMAPVQVPQYQALSPSREETITPEKIDQMNDYLQQLSAYSKADVVWSYTLMTFGGGSEYEEGGLHVIDNIARSKADVLLNLRCNADAASRGYPYDGTCCSNYKKPGGAQWIILFTSIVILPTLLFGRRKHFPQISHYIPSADILSALTVFSLVVCLCFYTDRSQLFEKAQKQFHKNEFTTPCIIVGIFGLVSIRRDKSSISNKASVDHLEVHGFLSRDQSDEWKGWMQAFILIYHYTRGSKSLEIYEIVRILVASYLFMTGYGHTICFLRSDDYSLRRVASVLLRLNMLAAALTYMMRTDYLFYYFPPLVSFWFLVLYFVLKLGHGRNSNPYFLIGKIFLSALITTAFTMRPGILEFIASVLKYTCKVSWNITEWRFRLFLDMYIVYVGMIIAVFHYRTSLLRSKSRNAVRCFDKILQLTITYNRFFKILTVALALTLAAGFWGLTRRSLNKEDYNWWQPYISFIPILCFVVLRNSHHMLRRYHSAFFAWLGRISLETYILQYHIWLAGDTKGLLRLGIWNRGIEAAILTPIFIWLSWSTSNATRKVISWFIDGSAHSPVHRLSDPLPAGNSKPSPYLLPRSNNEGSLSKEDKFDGGVNGRQAGWVVRCMMAFREDLRLRLCLIGVLIWLGNVTYR